MFPGSIVIMVPTYTIGTLSSTDLDRCEQGTSVINLTNEEVKSIHTLAITEPGMGQVTQLLAVEYLDSDFDKTLLHRVLDKKGYHVWCR